MNSRLQHLHIENKSMMDVTYSGNVKQSHQHYQLEYHLANLTAFNNHGEGRSKKIKVTVFHS